MANEEILELEKELERLRFGHPGLELAVVLNKLPYACMHSDPRKAEDYALEGQNPAEDSRSL